jgi:hypothetical protein
MEPRGSGFPGSADDGDSRVRLRKRAVEAAEEGVKESSGGGEEKNVNEIATMISG